MKFYQGNITNNKSPNQKQYKSDNVNFSFVKIVDHTFNKYIFLIEVAIIYVFVSRRSFYKSQDELINQYEEIRLDVDDAMENAETVKQLRKKASQYAKITFLVNLV